MKGIHLILLLICIVISLTYCNPVDNGDSGDSGGESFILTININGNGNVLSSPEPISITTNGNAKELLYNKDVIVTLTAEPNSDSIFLGWESYYVTGPTNPAIINMNSNKEITAYFYLESVTLYTLEVNNENGVFIEVSPEPVYRYSEMPDTTIYYYKENELLTITAIDTVCGTTFSHWEGDVTGEENPITLLINSNKIVSAKATKSFRLILVYDNQMGSVSVSPPTVIYLGDNVYKCKASQTITLTAIPNSNYNFIDWSGDIISSDNPVNVLMKSDKTINANFQ